jgi:TnpA family transposase
MQPETNATQKRMKILGDDEIEALYGRPHFTPAEQSQYFSLSAQENAALAQLHSLKSRLSFILQLGYFKARQQFFLFSLHEVEADARYIQEHYFPEFHLTDLAITKVTRLKQQRLILDLCHYRLCDPTERQQLAAKARQAARVCSKPIYVLRELLAYLSEQRLVAPGYSFLQDTVSAALTYEQNRLITLVQTQLTPTDREALQHLLADAQGLYEITLLKREPKDFSLGEIKREIERGEQIRPLYHLAQRLLPALDISNESIKYYASLVTYYSVFRLKQLDEQLVDLYLLCFLHHRYQRLHDHLITSLLHNVRRAVEAAKDAAKERVYAYRIEVNQDLHKAGRVLKLFTDDSIAQDAPFAEVQAKAFGMLDPQKLDFIADHLTTQASFDETVWQWEQIDRLAPQFKRHLRPLLVAVEFAATQAQAPLLEAVAFLKEVFQQGKVLGQSPAHAFPLRFIPGQTKRYLYAPDPRGGKRLRPDRYEFLVYRLLRNGLEAGDIFCQDSVRFRSFEDDLIDDQQWQKKEELLAASGLALLKQPMVEQLAALEALLEERIRTVNQRIAAGENDHFQIKRRGKHSRWTLHYPQDSEPVNHPFFDKLRQVEIGDVLHFVDQQCHFLDAFEHILGRYGQQETRAAGTRRVLTACLIAWATNMGLGKMGENSDLSDHLLAAASANFIRLETLRSANDLICNATAALPITRHYDLGATLHSSSDGQKFETGLPTINARHSPKYFGLKKGIVAYTLVANHIPVNARIIGADEHESHYVFDLLFNNTTDLQPEVHSTDTHGTNEVNFAILHWFGYQFAPRYQDIYDKVTNSLYGFQHPSQYADLVLKPIRKINTDLILAEEENIQRILLSLALKTTTQSIIVSKLSAYPRKNKTKRALWEYDNIIRSLYLLDYVDSPPLRQNVQRALNRGENYHKLRRAVSYANFGKLRFKTEHEQEIWNECSRLITNCIIYYNAFLLSQLLAYKESQGDEAGAALLKQVSPVAWQHINLHGRYEFNKTPTEIDINAIIHQLSQLPLPQVLDA